MCVWAGVGIKETREEGGREGIAGMNSPTRKEAGYEKLEGAVKVRGKHTAHNRTPPTLSPSSLCA